MNKRQTQRDVQYTNGILDHLLEQYLAGNIPPNQAGEPVTITLFHRLSRAVLAEGYGE